MKFINSIATFHPYNLSVSVKLDTLHKNINLEPFEYKEYIKIFLLQIQDNNLQEKSIKKFISNMPIDKQNKVLEHYTSVIHESKHFHDYILSPLGNYAIRRYFTLFADSIIILMNLSNDNKAKTVNTPLKYNCHSEEINELVSRHQRYMNNLKELFYTSNTLAKDKGYDITANDILEAGAVISQYSQIEELVDIDGAFDFQQYLKSNHRYTKTIDLMNNLIASHNKESGIVTLSNTMLNTLLFTSLCGNHLNDYHTINTQNPSTRFLNILGTLFLEYKKIDEKNIFENIELLAEKHDYITTKQALKENLDLNKNHKNYLKKVLFTNLGEENPLTVSLLKSYDWFLNYNKKITNKFLEDPYCFLDTVRYENEFLHAMPTPIILEDYSGYNIPLLIKQQSIDKDKFSSILHEGNLYSNTYRNWAIIFNRDISFKPIEDLYSYTSNLQFILFTGAKSNYNRVHPYIYKIMNDLIKENFLIELKEYFPDLSKTTHKSNMNHLWNTEFREYSCDICNDNIKQNSGYAVYGQELYESVIYRNISSKKIGFIEMYHNDFSIHCTCDNCYEQIKLN